MSSFSWTGAVGQGDPARLDRLGAVASSLCAVHCAICALLPAAFGMLGLGVLLEHNAEWALTMVAVTFALVALVVGWRRHRSRLVVGLLVLGVTGLLASRGLEMRGGAHDGHGASCAHAAAEGADQRRLAGGATGVVAGVLLVFGHMVNIRTTRRCRDEGCE